MNGQGPSLKVNEERPLPSATLSWADLVEEEELENPTDSDPFFQTRNERSQEKEQQERAGRTRRSEEHNGHSNGYTDKRSEEWSTVNKKRSRKGPKGRVPFEKRIDTRSRNNHQEKVMTRDEAKKLQETYNINKLARALMSFDSRKLQIRGYTFQKVLTPQEEFAVGDVKLKDFCILEVGNTWGDKILFAKR